ncbi:tyrosine-type recombinase/integrase [Vibrio chagasii]|uniref:tyrosine-type recombinase/integrase n=1 Tax=Vibrio chagasii TaxID=170679 RepID=UPI0016403BB8|nr:site-specific integrase [Vibrio chagasii]
MSRKTKNLEKSEGRTEDGILFYSFMSHKTGSIKEANEYINDMVLKSLPYNTVKSKASDLAKFYDFYLEASQVLHSDEYIDAVNQNSAMAASHSIRSALTLIFNGYVSYLLDGKGSKNPLARICAENTNSTPLARTSVARMISSLCDFVLASNALEHSRKRERVAGRLIDVESDLTVVGQKLGEVRSLSYRERAILVEKSYLASCISGGAKVTTIKNFFKLPRVPKSGDSKYFPLESVGRFLLSVESHRDRAIYALCFGGGLRISEASSIRFEDIDIINERVKLHDKTTTSYLEAVSYTNIVGKSVDHYSVHLIEPFKTFFFDELTQYLEEDRPESNHPYVFLQKRGIKNKLTGEMTYNPYYYSRKSTISEAWDRNLIKAGLTGEKYNNISTHSMRHFYAVYLGNFAPRADGSRGYSDAEVQYFMRHASLKSTKIYKKEVFEEMCRRIEETNTALVSKEKAFYEGHPISQLNIIENQS